MVPRPGMIVCALLLAGCPQHTPPAPPRDPPPAVRGGGGEGPEAGDHVSPAAAPDAVGAPEAGLGGPPRASAPGGGEGLAELLAPGGKGLAEVLPSPGPSGRGERGCPEAGGAWQEDCNTCRCGADGQVRCTTLACGAPRG